MTFYDEFKKNLTKSDPDIPQPDGIKGSKIVPIDPQKLINQLKLLLPYFCIHPSEILEGISDLKELALDSVIKELSKLTSTPFIIRNTAIDSLSEDEKTLLLEYYEYDSAEKSYFLRSSSLPHENCQFAEFLKNAGFDSIVWRGNIGEVIATAYVMSCTAFKVPIFKLRFAIKRNLSLPGDDLLGFQFHKNGMPKAMLIVEAKNYLSPPGEAVKRANKTLLRVKKSQPVLVDFIHNVLLEKGMKNQANLVRRFRPKYNNDYRKEFLAFVVTDKALWQDNYFNSIEKEPATPLEVVSFLVPSWKARQEQLLTNHVEKEFDFEFPDIEIKEINEINRLLENDEFKKDQKMLASAALSSDLKIEERERIKYRFDESKIESAAQFLAYSAICLYDESPNDACRNLNQAATIYEKLAIWQIENHNLADALKNIINGAVYYSIAGYDANSKVLIGRISQLPDIEAMVSDYPYHVFLNHLIMGNLHDLQDSIATFFFKSLHTETSDSFPNEEQKWLELIGEELYKLGTHLVGLAFSYFTYFLKTGDRNAIEKITNYLTKACTQFQIVGHYEAYNFTIILKKYFLNLALNSTFYQLSSKVSDFDDDWTKFLNFISNLGKFPMISLWKSQQKAINQGLLSDRPLFLSMPTSSGKTKIVELALFKSLKEKPNGICVYVVPTRALASEVEESLSKNFRRIGVGVASLYGGYDFSPFEQNIIDENQVFVLTPEKLDIIIRNHDDFKIRISLVIIDEAHEAAQPNPRGLRTEFILSRLIYIAEKNQARVLALSAVIQNPEDFATWFTKESSNIVNIDWRPTRQVFGLFEWGIYNTAIVNYGINPDVSEDFFVPLLFSKNDLKNNDYRNIEIASRMGKYYSRTGSTLIFTSTKNNIHGIVDCLLELQVESGNNINPQLARIIDDCERILGENHRVVKALKKGFCYHHRELPNSTKKLIEEALRKDIINLIVCTTTLSQGVNLPIKNVIVHSLSFDGGRDNTLSMTQFFNIIGRAGRAGRETEGHIIFCDHKDFDIVRKRQGVEKTESFIASGFSAILKTRFPSLKNIENFLEKFSLASTKHYRQERFIPQSLTVNQLNKIIDRIKSTDQKNFILNKAYYLPTRYQPRYPKYYLSRYLNDAELKRLERIFISIDHDLTDAKKKNAQKEQYEILSTFDSQLLAWIIELAIDEISDEAIDTIWGNLLCQIQLLDTSEIAEKFKQGLKNRTLYVKNNITDISQRTIFNKTALGIKSNDKINQYAKKLAEKVEEYHNLSMLPNEFWKEIYTTFAEIAEFGKISKIELDVFLDWISGKSYNEIAKEYYNNTIEKAVKDVEYITYVLPWGVFALLQHLKFYLSESQIPTTWSNLPSLIFHGVPDVLSVYAICQGIDDRNIAMAISKYYMNCEFVHEYNDFKKWLMGLDIDEWQAIFEDEQIDEGRLQNYFDKLKERTEKVSEAKFLMVFNFDGDHPDSTPRLNELTIAKIDDDFYLTTYDFQNFWKLLGENVQRLKSIDRRRRALVIEKCDFEKNSLSVRVY